MTLLSPWTKKFVAAGLLICLVAALWSFALSPLWRGFVSSMEGLKDAQFELSRSNLALAASKNVSEETIAEIEQAVVAQLTPGNNESEAVTHIQFLTDKLLKEHGLTLESIQATNPLPSGVLTRVNIEIRANGTEQKMIRFLAAVESTKPLLRVERLALRGMDAQIADKTMPERVTLEATLSAYWRPSLQGVAAQGQ